MRHLVVVFVVCGLSLASSGVRAQVDANDAARRRFEQGQKLLLGGNYKEALTDLDETIRVYPTSVWAGRAIALEVEYFLEVERDVERAKKDLERLKTYSADVAPAAYLLSGRTTLASSRTKESLASAALDFQRAEQYYPGSSFVPEARYRTGEAYRLNRQIDEAIERFQNVVLAYPRSVWSARAGIRLAECLVARGRWQEALGALQRLRIEFANVPEAAAESQSAITLNTILFRLYVRRGADRQAFSYAGLPFVADVRIDDVAAMTFMPADVLVIAAKSGVVLFDANGTLLPRVFADEPSALARRRRDDSVEVQATAERLPVYATRRGLVFGTGPGGVVGLRVSDGNEKPRLVEHVAAMVQHWNRDWIVADRDAKGLFAFSDKGDYRGPFLPDRRSLQADRMVSTSYDDVAVLDGDRKRVTVLDRDGRVLSHIEPTGAGYRFDRPVDLTIDALGHIYVLDRAKGQVFVFAPVVGPEARLLAVFDSLDDKAPSAFRKPTAFSLDSRGRLFIFDEDARRIQVFQ